ncbi:MAG TPA: tail fiber domain-containing protein [Bacteroidia bacterium]|jgi:hypothetical protein|nr:tail fiber domain-containing protein [Bacteroidia bacterium]
MKNLKIALAFIIACTMSKCAISQVHITNAGAVSIGSIAAPPGNAELQVIGNSVFSSSIGPIISSAYIKGTNSFSANNTPDYTWWGDTLVGIFHPALNAMAFANMGKMTMLLSSQNNVVIDSSVDNGDKLQVNGSLNKNPFDVFSNTTAGNLYSGINWVNNSSTKAWAVKNGGADEFYVLGNGQSYSYGWNTISDSTLKENVYSIQNALDKVLRLHGVTYNLKSNRQVRQMGLIAQAVERVIPEVVSTNNNGIKTIAYSNMVGLLVEAIKQEDVKVNSLQHRLDSCLAMNKQTGLNLNNKAEAKLYPCSSCPANQNATFQCYVPAHAKNASLLVFDLSGALKKTIAINGKEMQYVSVNSGELNPGMYYYSLMVDGTEIDTKKIVMTQD